MRRKQHCPTCVALHKSRSRDFELKGVREADGVIRDLLKCGYCGRTWKATRLGFKRASDAQSEMPL